MLGWPRRCQLAQDACQDAFMWEHSYKGLKLTQLLGQLGVFFAQVTATVSGGHPEQHMPHENKVFHERDGDTTATRGEGFFIGVLDMFGFE